jgi:PiT family inorganic phosphate transporter
MLFWAIGLSSWLGIFWARLIKAVWNDITKIDQIRAFCIALSAAITVLLASALWLPVSSTQITLWAIFGIWLFRKYLSIKRWDPKETINIWMMKWIMLSWVVTLPVSWLLSAFVYIIIMKF